MAKYRASLSKGRTGWCVIFRHPVCKSTDGRQPLRVRRGLGTKIEAEADAMVAQLNEILSDPGYWNPNAKERAEAKFAPQIVGAFYDHISPEKRDGWTDRGSVIRLPTKDDGYAVVQLVGTTGAGKTTAARQLIGTDPKKERFPSISPAKTTICDLELVLEEGDFRAAVSFIPRDQVRQYITECAVAAVSAHLESNPNEVVRRFMEHSEQRFRLGYLLGHVITDSSESEELNDGDGESEEIDLDDAEVSSEEQRRYSERLHEFLEQIEEIAVRKKEAIAEATDLKSELSKVSLQDRDALQELVEEQLLQDDEFHSLVDRILDEVEDRFEVVDMGSFERGRDGWPRIWTLTSDVNDRQAFIRAVNRFSSNYAPHFGRLLTPLVEGIRVAGPFSPEWYEGGVPPVVLLDGQGIGHTADSTSSISTTVTKRFQIADMILLVDNAAQPMQAAPVAVLRTLISSGHEAKIGVLFTHFDEVKGDNLRNNAAKVDHVTGSFYNAVHAIGKTAGRDAEQSLKRLIPDRLFFVSGIQEVPLPTGSRFTRAEFRRLLDVIGRSILPPPPANYYPVYDVANLVLAIQNSTQEFHDAWRGVLGYGTRSGVAPEHWTRVKALTRWIGTMNKDEYDSLRPIADLIRFFQSHVSRFLAEPLNWKPEAPTEDRVAEKVQAIDKIRTQVFARLHELSRRRLIDERLSGWVEAHEHRGTGSTKVRARELVTLYESAAPVPTEMPGPDLNEFLFEVRELVAESILAGEGEIRGWSREPELV